MAAVILACGDHRQVYRHAQVLIHQLMGGMAWRSRPISRSWPSIQRMRAELDELLAEHGNLSAQEFHELTERDCWCNARRALELGLVDEVIAPSKKAL